MEERPPDPTTLSESHAKLHAWEYGEEWVSEDERQRYQQELLLFGNALSMLDADGKRRCVSVDDFFSKLPEQPK